MATTQTIELGQVNSAGEVRCPACSGRGTEEMTGGALNVCTLCEGCGAADRDDAIEWIEKEQAILAMARIGPRRILGADYGRFAAEEAATQRSVETGLVGTAQQVTDVLEHFVGF